MFSSRVNSTLTWKIQLQCDLPTSPFSDTYTHIPMVNCPGEIESLILQLDCICALPVSIDAHGIIQIVIGGIVMKRP